MGISREKTFTSTTLIHGALLANELKISPQQLTDETQTASQKSSGKTALTSQETTRGNSAWDIAKNLLTDKISIFRQMNNLYIRRALAKIFSLSEDYQLLDMTDSALGKLPKSTDNNPNSVKQLSDQQTKLRESQVKVEEAITILENNSKKTFEAQNIQFNTLIKLGALKSEKIAYDPSVNSQIQKEINNIKKIDTEYKTIEKDASDLSTQIKSFAKLVRKRAPEQVLATTQDQQAQTTMKSDHP